MDLMHYIKIDSIEKAERILDASEFDDISKAAQYRFHKYVNKVFKNGKIRYIYEQGKNVRKIKGKKKVLTNTKEITIDRKGKFMLAYTDDMKTDLLNKVSSLSGVTNARWANSNTTESNYFKCKKDGLSFKVRISQHSIPSEKNEILSNLYYNNNGHFWFIDASLGKFKPNDITMIIENVIKANRNYNTDDFLNRLVDFAKSNSFSPTDEEDCLNMAHTLAEKYINKCKLKDDKYGSTFQVLLVKSIEALIEVQENYIDSIVNEEINNAAHK